jgi:hypothetical protein
MTTGLGDVSPIDGVRISLDLRESSSNVATYECAIRWSHADTKTPAKALGSARVTIDPPGVEFSQLEVAPEAALSFVRTLLRTTARSVQNARWPRRITRWRDED